MRIRVQRFLYFSNFIIKYYTVLLALDIARPRVFVLWKRRYDERTHLDLKSLKCSTDFISWFSVKQDTKWNENEHKLT